MRTCPRCGGPADEARTDPGFPRPGALSRWDNRTVVCTDCGQQEAIIEWMEGRNALHPLTGVLTWQVSPSVQWIAPLRVVVIP